MLNGRRREMGLGPLAILSLAEARERANECRKMRLDGIDPDHRSSIRGYVSRALNGYALPMPRSLRRR